MQTFLFKVLPPHHEILPAALLQTNLYKKSTDCQNYLHTKSTPVLTFKKSISYSKASRNTENIPKIKEKDFLNMATMN